MKQSISPEEEYELYAHAGNQEPQGPARRRERPNLTEVDVDDLNADAGRRRW
jgi:hypothetical protein